MCAKLMIRFVSMPHRRWAASCATVVLLLGLPCIGFSGDGQQVADPMLSSNRPRARVEGLPPLIVPDQREGKQRLALADGGDPHAHHRHMMESKGYARSIRGYDLPPLQLLGLDGTPTTLAREIDCDKPVILNFIFTTCTTICPVLSATFSQLQKQLGTEEVERVRMISITIDPEYDTPERLRAYAQRFDAGPQWRFFTGDPDDIVTLQRAFAAYHGSKMNHEPVTFLRASPAASWVRLDGFASASDMLREYRRLLLQ